MQKKKEGLWGSEVLRGLISSKVKYTSMIPITLILNSPFLTKSINISGKCRTLLKRYARSREVGSKTSLSMVRKYFILFILFRYGILTRCSPMSILLFKTPCLVILGSEKT